MTALTAARAADLRSALATVCLTAGLADADAELIRYTVHAVYRLPAAGLVVRLAEGPAAAERAWRVVATARWLAVRGAPTLRPAEEVPAPVLTAGWAATFWPELRRPTVGAGHLSGAGSGSDAGSGAGSGALAGPLRALHRIAPDATLPRWSPFRLARCRLAAANRLAAADADWLATAWQTAWRDYQRLASALRHGVIHGDAHPGNLLRDPTGRAVLCDLDDTGVGPLDWDLVPAAVAAARFGGTGGYAALAEAYGGDVTATPGWPLLRRIRELVMVTAVLPDLANRPAMAAEHARRLDTLRAGRLDATWQRYD